jgi:hypothetical protein
MFGGKEGEQGRQIAEAAFPILDEIEAEDWHWGKAEKAKLEGPGAATKTADEIARLLPVCKSFQVPLLDVLERWVESRQQAFEEQGDEDRAAHVSVIWLSLGLYGYGNLFGLVSQDAAAYNADLAAEGRARGWRK